MSIKTLSLVDGVIISRVAAEDITDPRRFAVLAHLRARPDFSAAAWFSSSSRATAGRASRLKLGVGNDIACPTCVVLCAGRWCNEFGGVMNKDKLLLRTDQRRARYWH